MKKWLSIFVSSTYWTRFAFRGLITSINLSICVTTLSGATTTGFNMLANKQAKNSQKLFSKLESEDRCWSLFSKHLLPVRFLLIASFTISKSNTFSLLRIGSFNFSSWIYPDFQTENAAFISTEKVCILCSNWSLYRRYFPLACWKAVDNKATWCFVAFLNKNAAAVWNTKCRPLFTPLQ